MTITFKPASEQKIAYSKTQIYGPTGSGRSTLGAKIAIGLIDRFKLKKEVHVFDTERRAKAIYNKQFKPAKIACNVLESRSLLQAKEFMRRCAEDQVVGMIDNASHLWSHMMKNYLDKKNESRKKKAAQNNWKYRPLTRCYLGDWQILKPRWNEFFDDPFLTSNAHIILIARDKDVFVSTLEREGDPDTRTIEHAGTLPRLEKNTSFEPYLIVETWLNINDDFHTSTNGKWDFMAGINKDNYGPLTGKRFTNPEFKNMLPAFEALDIGDAANEVDLSGSDEAFQDVSDSDSDYQETGAAKKAIIANMKDILERIFPGTGQKDKAKRTTVLKSLAGFSAIEKLQTAHIDSLKFWELCCQEIENKFSAYVDLQVGMQEGLITELTETQSAVIEFFEVPATPMLEKNIKALADDLHNAMNLEPQNGGDK